MRSSRAVFWIAGPAALLLLVVFVLRDRNVPDPGIVKPVNLPGHVIPSDPEPTNGHPNATTLPPTSSAQERAKLSEILARIRPLLGRSSLSKDEERLLHSLRLEFSRAAWSSRSSVQAMLALAAEVAEDPIQIDFILEAVGPRVYSTAQLLERAAVDGELTGELVQQFLAGQKSPALKRLYLTVLRCDLEREVSAAGINPKKIVYRLDDPLLKSLLAETRGSQDYGLVHQAMVLAGFYSDRNPSAASFLQGLIQDPLVPKDVRLTALSSYATGHLNEARVQLAESLLRENGNPEIRKAAMNLLIAPADRTMTDPVRLAAVDILKNLAVQEKDPELRAIAVDSLMKMGRNDDAIATAGQLIQAESDPTLRSRFAKAFKDVSFQTREQAFSAQDLMIGLFKSDPSEAVRESAVDAYLQLVQSTILKEGQQTIDMQTVGGIERLVSILVSRPAAASTKALIRRRLESDYEKMFPDLLRTEQYVALKRSLLQE